MSLPTEIVMPGDNAANPFVIPGTSRSHTCTAGSAITVPGEDAILLKGQGWVGAHNALILGPGPTSSRPVAGLALKGQGYMDTTIDAVVVYGGPVTGWLNPFTGASA
jgi:hypothetical protein